MLSVGRDRVILAGSCCQGMRFCDGRRRGGGENCILQQMLSFNFLHFLQLQHILKANVSMLSLRGCFFLVSHEITFNITVSIDLFPPLFEFG